MAGCVCTLAARRARILAGRGSSDLNRHGSDDALGGLQQESGERIELASRHRIGRDPWSDWVIDDPGVSGAHAMVAWSGSHWTIRDLGSSNGTWVANERIAVGSNVRLTPGTVIQVGGRSFTLVDAGPPRPMVVGPNGCIVLESAVQLPGTNAHLIPDASGGWWLDDGQPRLLAGRTVFVAGGVQWTAYLDGALAPTREDNLASDSVHLQFRVSRDEEHVDLWVCRASERIPIPPRAHHYTLVTLARRRIADRAAGIAEADAGWVETDTLGHELRLQRGAIYTHLWRARKQLTASGFTTVAEQLVEHRIPSAQIRWGMGQVEVGLE